MMLFRRIQYLILQQLSIILMVNLKNCRLIDLTISMEIKEKEEVVVNLLGFYESIDAFILFYCMIV